jgi:mannose/fructose/N-acetylgalactosamine-specific phosphotransferase system component IIC
MELVVFRIFELNAQLLIQLPALEYFDEIAQRTLKVLKLSGRWLVVLGFAMMDQFLT